MHLSVIPLPIILALQNFQVHVCTVNSSDVTTYIEVFVYKALGFCSTLSVPNVEPHMSDFGETLMTLGLEASITLLKMWLSLMIFSTISAIIDLLVSFFR